MNPAASWCLRISWLLSARDRSSAWWSTTVPAWRWLPAAMTPAPCCASWARARAVNTAPTCTAPAARARRRQGHQRGHGRISGFNAGGGPSLGIFGTAGDLFPVIDASTGGSVDLIANKDPIDFNPLTNLGMRWLKTRSSRSSAPLLLKAPPAWVLDNSKIISWWFDRPESDEIWLTGPVAGNGQHPEQQGRQHHARRYFTERARSERRSMARRRKVSRSRNRSSMRHRQHRYPWCELEFPGRHRHQFRFRRRPSYSGQQPQ